MDQLQVTVAASGATGKRTAEDQPNGDVKLDQTLTAFMRSLPGLEEAASVWLRVAFRDRAEGYTPLVAPLLVS